MRREILKYLFSFTDRKYHELNDWVRKQGWEDEIGDVRSALQQLADKHKIEIAKGESPRWGLMTKINEISEIQNTMATLDNWKIAARITDDQREIMDEEAERQEKFNKKEAPLIHIAHIEKFTGSYNSGEIEGNQSFEQAFISPDTQYPNNSNANKPTKTSWLQILYWVVGILVALTILWEFILKKLFNIP